MLGHIFKMTNTWNAVPCKYYELSPINGFKTRFGTSQVLIDIARMQKILEPLHE